MRPTWLHPFYQIVDRADWLERLLPVGVRLVQLRIKDMAESKLRTESVKARDLCRAHGAQLVINDYWQLAMELGCDFVHIGQEDLALADMAAMRAGRLKVGISTHDHAELETALRHAPDYVALGPIYPTILKKMTFGPQGLERIREWKALIGQTPLVAIGGLRVEHAAGIFAQGADAVSVVTDVLLNASPETRAAQWLAAVKVHAG